jgi:hypothetical protein
MSCDSALLTPLHCLCCICSVALDIYADIPGFSRAVIEQIFGSNLMALSMLISGHAGGVGH